MLNAYYRNQCCCCNGKSATQKNIIFTAAIALLLTQVLTVDGMDVLGNTLSSIGSLLQSGSSCKSNIKSTAEIINRFTS